MLGAPPAPARFVLQGAGAAAAGATAERTIWSFATSTPIDRAGLAVGPWKVVTSESFDALVIPGHEKSAEGVTGTISQSGPPPSPSS